MRVTKASPICTQLRAFYNLRKEPFDTVDSALRKLLSAAPR